MITAINKMQIKVCPGLVYRTILILMHFEFINIDDRSCDIAQHSVNQVSCKSHFGNTSSNHQMPSSRLSEQQYTFRAEMITIIIICGCTTQSGSWLPLLKVTSSI
ncbi:hypothetical protein L798_10466 [Zootermopsis nevadensis]|uniref:Uncharacterized protein n=1 Tax=Zootermopsis nevadensis TaxID=136037 RepID=A0A067R0U3_ZOONE|nr:hypothetical protein L798_10466 [Zootermopsis nevadensis]